MIVIAMDTSGNVGSAAVLETGNSKLETRESKDRRGNRSASNSNGSSGGGDAKVVEERVFTRGLKHGADLAPALDEVFREHRLDRHETGLVCVSTGPGSYTGLRVGIATAKGLAFALDVPLIGVPAPDAMVRNLDAGWGETAEARKAWVLINARRRQLYVSRYHAEAGEWKLEGGHGVHFVRDVLDMLDPDAILLGDGVPVLVQAGGRRREAGGTAAKADGAEEEQEHGQHPSEPWHIASEDAWIARARFVGMLGYRRWKEEPRDERLTVEPLYLRLSEAEETWARRQSKV